MILLITKGKDQSHFIHVGLVLKNVNSSVYVELADQYKVMDAVSDVPRRNMLARHLREVVDILEQKASNFLNYRSPFSC